VASPSPGKNRPLERITLELGLLEGECGNSADVGRTYTLVMAALCNRAGHYNFALWFLFLSSLYLFSSPNLSRRRLDVYHTSTHGVALVRISDAGVKRAARSSLKVQDANNRQKFAIWTPSHKFVGLYLRN